MESTRSPPSVSPGLAARSADSPSIEYTGGKSLLYPILHMKKLESRTILIVYFERVSWSVADPKVLGHPDPFKNNDGSGSFYHQQK